MRISEILTPSFKMLRKELGIHEERKGSMVELCRSNDSDFCREVVAKGWLTEEQMAHAAERYRLGRSRSGRCIFWMIDEIGRVYDGHVGDTWVSTMLKAREPELLREWHTEHCLFGTQMLNLTRKSQNRWSSESNVSLLRHCRVAKEEDEVKSQKRLRDESEGHTERTDYVGEAQGENLEQRTESVFGSLRSKSEENLEEILIKPHAAPSDRTDVVAVVESERSAVILSEVFPEYMWMASVYPMNLNVGTLQALCGHRVVLFPPTDETGETYLAWLEVADQARRELHLDISVSSVLEDGATEEQKRRKIDLVEYLWAEPKVRGEK